MTKKKGTKKQASKPKQQKVHRSHHLLCADRKFERFEEVTPKILKAEGVKFLMCDLDNTLRLHSEKVPGKKLTDWIKKCRKAGVEIVIISNNGRKKMMQEFCKPLGVHCVWWAKKPLRAKLVEAMEKYHFEPAETAMLGDKWSTDVLAAKFAHVRSWQVEHRKKLADYSREARLNGPTTLTIVRMVMSVVFFILAQILTPAAAILTLLIFIAGAISDNIDGRWARKSNKVTDIGAFLDPLADKMLINLAFLALVIVGARTGLEIVPAWVLAVILVRDYAVDGMRMMAAREGITISANFYGKLKTTLQLTAIIILLVNQVLRISLGSMLIDWGWISLVDAIAVIGDIALYLSLIMVVWSGADYIIRNWKKVIK